MQALSILTIYISRRMSIATSHNLKNQLLLPFKIVAGLSYATVFMHFEFADRCNREIERKSKDTGIHIKHGGQYLMKYNSISITV